MSDPQDRTPMEAPQPVLAEKSAGQMLPGPRRKNLLFYLLMVALVLGGMEAMCCLTARHLAQKGRGLYLPGISESYESYRSRLHPELGWPSPQSASQRPDYFDKDGSRICPAFPNPDRHKTYVSLYGDSYTEGFGVSHEDTWGNVLARLIGVRVANYGISGYGSDQAYLRYHHNSQDQAAIVILSHFTQNIARNVNQLRNFLAPSRQCQMKPRFILTDGGHLELIAIPELSREDYLNLEENPGKYLHHDFFRPGGQAGMRTVSFPYLLSLMRAFGTIAKYLVNPAYWRDLYEPGHPSRALPVTVALFSKFQREARSRGQKAVVFILPSRGDMTLHHTRKTIYYHTLITELQKCDVEAVDIGEKFAERLRPEEACTLFSPESDYHYSIQGNKLLGEIVAGYLREKNLLAGFPTPFLNH